MSTTWVTGSTGFSGQHMLQWLANNRPNDEIIALSRSAETRLDMTDFDAVLDMCRRHPPKRVFHLAGAMPPASADDMWTAFVRSTYNLLRALDEADCMDVRVVISGSAAEYQSGTGEPIGEDHPCGGRSPYGIAKAAQTLLALKSAEIFGQDVVIARTFNLIGPGMSRFFVLGEICAQLAEGVTELKLGNIESERDFIDIRDAVTAYGLLMESNASGGVYNVCTGVPTPIRRLIDMAVDASGADVTVASASDLLRTHDFDRVIGDPTQLQSLIGWQPSTSLEQTVADVVASFRH